MSEREKKEIESERKVNEQVKLHKVASQQIIPGKWWCCRYRHPAWEAVLLALRDVAVLALTSGRQLALTRGVVALEPHSVGATRE